MRDESLFVKWGDASPPAGAIMATVPPPAGTQTRSVEPPPVCSRKFRAGERTATMRRPSSEYTGWVNDAGLVVRRCGSPPETRTRYNAPPSALLHVVYA